MYTLHLAYDLDIQKHVLCLYRGDELIAAAPGNRIWLNLSALELINDSPLPVVSYDDGMCGTIVTAAAWGDIEQWTNNDGMAHALFSEAVGLSVEDTLIYPTAWED